MDAHRLEDQDLTIYPCPVCDGLHVGHRLDAEARRRRSIIKEVESLDRRIRGLSGTTQSCWTSARSLSQS
jgi:hypothetical protein